MKKTNKPKPSDLREKAEELTKKKKQKSNSLLSEPDALKLIHKLEVHQKELELQNEELVRAKELATSIATGKYTELYNFAPTGYLTFSNEGEIMELNLSAAEIFGRGRSRLVGSRFELFVNDYSKRDFTSFLEKVFRSKTRKSCELKLSVNANEKVYVQLIGIASADKSQCFISMVDITEIKLVNEALALSEQKLSNIYNTMSDGMALHEIVYDNSGKAVDYIITDVNPAFEKFTGLNKSVVLGRKATVAYSVEEAPFLNIYAEVESSGKSKSFETFFPPMDKYFSIAVFTPGKGKFVTIFQDITERMRIGEALAESERKYRELIKYAPSGIFNVDFVTGLFTEVNDAMCVIMGYTHNEFLTMTPFEILDEEGKEQFRSRIGNARSGIQPSDAAEYHVRKKDGSYIWALLNITFNWSREKIISATVIAHDITERKKIEDALKESEARFRTIAESLPVLISLSFSDDSKIAYTNNAYNEAFGYTKDELTGHAGPEVYYDPDERKKMIDAVREQGFVKNYQLKAKKADGTPIWLLSSVQPITFEGRPAIIGASIDITERKRFEEALTFQAHLLSEVHDAVFSSDNNFIITYWNQAAVNMFGWTKEEALGKTSGELLKPKTDISSLDEVRRKLRDEGYWIGEGQYLRKDGTYFFVEVNSKTMKDVDGKYVGQIVVVRDITDRKRADEALRQSGERFRLALKNAPVGVAIQDKNLVYQWAYNQASRSTEEILGKTDSDLFAPEDLEWITPLKKEILETGKEMYTEQWLTSNGRKFFLGISYEPLRDSSGNVTGIGMATVDLTEEKLIEEALYLSRQEWIETFDKIPDLIAIIDTSHRIIRANKAMLNKLGVSLNEAKGLHCYECVHASKEPPLNCPHTMLLKDGKEHITEVYEEKLGGDFLVSATPIFDKDNKLTGSVHVARNITERKKSEKKLNEAQEKLSIALENGNIGIWEWNLVTDEIFWDKNSMEMMRVNETDVVKSYKDFEGLLNEEDIPHVQRALKRTINLNVPFNTIYRLKSPEGDPVYINSKAMLYKDDKGNPYRLLGVVIDISEMKKGTDKVLFNLNEELLRSNKELQSFAYVASHDLQEPLRMISSFTQLLQKKYSDKLDQNAQDYINFAVDGANRMYDLINGLLDYSRIQTKGKIFKTVKMQEIIEMVKRNLKNSLADKNVSVTSEILPDVYGDEAQMLQLMQNLVGNAVKFNKENKNVYIGVAEEHDNYVFSVKDEGIGIEAQYFDRIFQIFQRLVPRDEYVGTGIGLAICKRIVERHGGKIWVESEPDKGSTFYFTLSKIKNK